MSTPFRDFYKSLDAAGREQYAARVGTTVGRLRQVAMYGRRVSLGFADALVSAAPLRARLKTEDLPLTEAARRQLTLRRQPRV